MKRVSKNVCSYLLVFISIFFLTGCNQSASTREQQKTSQRFSLHDLLSYSDTDSYPLISAHRGGPTKGYPENALQTFQYTSQIRPLLIECDIRMSKDSVLVLMHDETIDRTTDGTGKVSDMTYEELSQYYLKDHTGGLTGFKIPTLQEALAWGIGKVVFTLDIKRDVPYELLISTIRDTNAENYCVLITYSAGQATKIHHMADDLYISASIKTEDDLARILKNGVAKDKLIAFVGTSIPDAKIINSLHQNGIKTIVGTLGNLDKQAKARGDQLYAELAQKGVDVLSTDRPFAAKKSLDFYADKRGLKAPVIN